MPNRERCVGEINEFVNRHFSLLCAERRDELPVDLKAANLGSDGALTRSLKSNAARGLSNATFVIAMKMELTKDVCVEMMPQIVSDTDFGGLKHLLIAAADLEMTWLEDEILKRVDLDGPGVSLYVLLKSYVTDYSEKTRLKICKFLLEKTPKDTYGDYKIFCEQAVSIDSVHLIEKLQSAFQIVNWHNVRCFIEKDFSFVSLVSKITKHQTLRRLIDPKMLSDEHVKLLMRDENWQILRESVTYDRMKRVLLEMLKSEKDKMSLFPAIYIVLCVTPDLEKKQEILDLLDPKMLRFISFIRSPCELQDVKVFLDENPEYVNKAVMEYANGAKQFLLLAFSEKLREMGGLRIVINEETSWALLMHTKTCDFEKFRETGMVLTLNCEVIRGITTAGQKETLLSNPAQVNIPKYTVPLARVLCEYKLDHLFDQLRCETNSAWVIDEYIRMVEKEKR